MSQRANQLLIVAGIGLLLAYPFHHWGYGVGTFFMHFFAAALIGGIADWYGVTLLFKRPLGTLFHKPFNGLFQKSLHLPWEQPIIVKRHEGLIEVAKDMIGNDLLTKDNIYKYLKDERPLGILLAYSHTREGRAALKVLFHTVAKPFLKSGSLEAGAEELMGRIKAALMAKDVTPYMVAFFRLLAKREYSEPLWIHVNRLLQGFMSSDQLRPHLTNLLERAIDEYKEDVMLRQWVDFFREDFISTDTISEHIQVKAVDFLEENEELSSPMGEAFHSLLLYVGTTLETNGTWQVTLNEKKNALLEKIALSSQAYMEVDSLEEDLLRYIYEWLDHAYEAYCKRGEALPIEVDILKALEDISPALSNWAQEATETELRKYSGEEIAHLLEGKVYDDVQGIRITGTLIGGILGATFFFVSFLVKEVVR